jgi:hypothetical protein
LNEVVGGMIALIFEVYGAFCFFSLAAFLVWAAVAKLRPDLDEEEFEELEKLKKLANSELPSFALPNEDPITEILLSQPEPVRPVKQSKHPIRRRPHLFHSRKPRLT